MVSTNPTPQNSQPQDSATSAAGVSRLSLPGTPDSLPKIRDLVVDAAERCHFEPEDVAKIEMAVGEACTNIIEHAYRTQPHRLEIEVEVQPMSDRLEIIIIDYSTINFPIDEIQGLGIDEYIETERRRGLGLFIIRSFVDKLEHRFICGQGNELRLVKYLA